MEGAQHRYYLRRTLRPSKRAQEIDPAIGNRVDRLGRPRPTKIRLVNWPQARENITASFAEPDGLRDRFRYVKIYGGPLILYSLKDKTEQRHIWHRETDRNRPITQFWRESNNSLVGLFDKEAGEFIYRDPKLPAEYFEAYNLAFVANQTIDNVTVDYQDGAGFDSESSEDAQDMEESEHEVQIKVEDDGDNDIAMQDLHEIHTDTRDAGEVEIKFETGF